MDWWLLLKAISIFVAFFTYIVALPLVWVFDRTILGIDRRDKLVRIIHQVLKLSQHDFEFADPKVGFVKVLMDLKFFQAQRDARWLVRMGVVLGSIFGMSLGYLSSPISSGRTLLLVALAFAEDSGEGEC